MTETPGEYTTPWFPAGLPEVEKQFECFRCGQLAPESQGKWRQESHGSGGVAIYYPVFEHRPCCPTRFKQTLEGEFMTDQPKPTKRVRIEVSTSVKGVHTYSCTIENVSDDIGVDVIALTLQESTQLVKDLDALYPASA